MMAKEIKLDAVELNKYITVHVELKRFTEGRIRWWIAMQLFKLAAIVANCNIEVEEPTS